MGARSAAISRDVDDRGGPRIVVLASGGGSNLQALIDATASGRLAAQVVAVVSNRPEAGALDRARRARIDSVAVVRRADERRHDYDARLADAVAAFDPDWIVLAGWMHLLSMAFLARFPQRVINLHPALPGELPGTRAIERAFDEARAGHRSRTGVMVHLVPDEGVDNGPVLATATVPIAADDSLDTLAARIHDAEHSLLVDTMIDLCRHEVHA
jgi:phosphoribosylglycinamide formyltransferase 1